MTSRRGPLYSPAMTITDQLSLGQPRFNDEAMVALAAREGNHAAWQQAFAQLGAQAPATVSGDFAIALHTPDGRTFLAVDRFAIQTLCYRRIGDGLYFAPRADALADTVPVLDAQAIFDYLYFHVIPSPRTIYKDVYRVPPGHYVLFENGTLTLAPYWQPTFEEPRRASFADLRVEFLRTLRDAIASQIDRNAIGCYLSGGTDSSTVAGIVTAMLGRPADTYSIGFDAKGYDEMEYARLAAKHFKTQHHEYYVTPDDLVKSLPAVAAHYDQPFGNSSAVPAYHCARMAKESGIHKMLAGDGGDELFGGNSRYATQRVFSAYQALPGFVRKGLAEPLTDSGLFNHIPLLKKGASYVRQARIPMPERMQSYNLLMHLGLNDVLTADFLAQVDPSEPIRQQREVYDACTSPLLVNRMLAYDWRYTLAENDLPKVIGSAQLAGVSVGFPLLDDRLLEFSLTLPAHYKVKGLKLRWFFKESLHGFLPDAILKKKKHGFGLPFGVWANSHAPLNTLAAEALHSLAGRGIVRETFIDTLLTRQLPAHPGFYGEMVWVLTILELWLRAHAPEYRCASV